MRTVFFISTLVFFSINSFSQPAFGVQVGSNLGSANLKGHYNNKTAKLDTDPRLGFLAGVVAEFHLGKYVNFRPEINFIQKGYKHQHDKNILTDPSGKATVNYIEMPLNISLHLPSTKGRLFVGFGPTLALGVSGKIKEKDFFENFPPSQTITVKFDGDKPVIGPQVHLTPFEFSINVMMGYKITPGLFAAFTYTAGLTDNLPGEDFIDHWTNYGLALKIGYYFSGVKNHGTKNQRW